MRNVGTKHAAKACDPVQYLTKCGETDTLSDQYVLLAEAVRPTWYVSGQGPGQLQLVRYSTSLE